MRRYIFDGGWVSKVLSVILKMSICAFPSSWTGPLPWSLKEEHCLGMHRFNPSNDHFKYTKQRFLKECRESQKVPFISGMCHPATLIFFAEIFFFFNLFVNILPNSVNTLHGAIFLPGVPAIERGPSGIAARNHWSPHHSWESHAEMARPVAETSVKKLDWSPIFRNEWNEASGLDEIMDCWCRWAWSANQRSSFICFGSWIYHRPCNNGWIEKLKVMLQRGVRRGQA